MEVTIKLTQSTQDDGGFVEQIEGFVDGKPVGDLYEVASCKGGYVVRRIQEKGPSLTGSSSNKESARKTAMMQILGLTGHSKFPLSD